MSKWRERIEIVWQLGVPMLAVTLLFFAIWHTVTVINGTGPDLITPIGLPFGADFLSLWSAGWLAATGNAAGAYDPAAIYAAQQVGVPAATTLTLFHYPPPFLLLLAPLSHLPYLAAFILFTGLTGLGFLWVLWRLRPSFSTLLLALAYPAFWLNLLSGQNAFLSGVFLGMALLVRTPWIQGIWFGLLTYKPQLGLPIPFALAIGRRWMVIWNAAFAALILAWLSLTSFGPGVWQAFFNNSEQPLAILAAGRIPLDRMATAFSAVLLLGGSLSTAFIAQGLSVLIALLGTMAIWKSPAASQNLKGAALGLAMLMATPHLFNYDLTILAVPLILWLKEAESTKWLPGERILLLLTWLAPFFALPERELENVNFYPFLFIILQLFLLKRLKFNESQHASASTS